MIGLIAAVSVNGVIGIEEKLPFDYPEDMKHFRTTTANSVVIMGRITFNGIGRPLPKRRNIIVSRIAKGLGTLNVDGIETASSVDDAMEMCKDETRNIWFIGGSSIYEAGMNYADKIILTLTPDVELRTPAVKFPFVNPNLFKLESVASLVPENLDCKLKLATYIKI